MSSVQSRKLTFVSTLFMDKKKNDLPSPTQPLNTGGNNNEQLQQVTLRDVKILWERLTKSNNFNGLTVTQTKLLMKDIFKCFGVECPSGYVKKMVEDCADRDEFLNFDQFKLIYFTVLKKCKVHMDIDLLQTIIPSSSSIEKFTEYIRCPFLPETHNSLLCEFWRNVFLTPPPRIPHHDWKELGFQGSDPSTDFRGSGLCGIECLVFLSKFKEFSNSLKQSADEHEIPFATMGINIVMMLFELLGYGFKSPGVPSGSSPKTYPTLMNMLFDKDETILPFRKNKLTNTDHNKNPKVINNEKLHNEKNEKGFSMAKDVFMKLFLLVFGEMKKNWIRMAASYLDFPSVAQRTIVRVEELLSVKVRNRFCLELYLIEEYKLDIPYIPSSKYIRILLADEIIMIPYKSKNSKSGIKSPQTQPGKAVPIHEQRTMRSLAHLPIFEGTKLVTSSAHNILEDDSCSVSSSFSSSSSLNGRKWKSPSSKSSPASSSSSLATSVSDSSEIPLTSSSNDEIKPTQSLKSPKSTDNINNTYHSYEIQTVKTSQSANFTESPPIKTSIYHLTISETQSIKSLLSSIFLRRGIDINEYGIYDPSGREILDLETSWDYLRTQEITVLPRPVNINSSWSPNTEKCQICNSKFGLIFGRPHHCRICGKCVCDNCSKHRIHNNANLSSSSSSGGGGSSSNNNNAYNNLSTSNPSISPNFVRVCDVCRNDITKNGISFLEKDTSNGSNCSACGRKFGLKKSTSSKKEENNSVFNCSKCFKNACPLCIVPPHSTMKTEICIPCFWSFFEYFFPNTETPPPTKINPKSRTVSEKIQLSFDTSKKLPKNHSTPSLNALVVLSSSSFSKGLDELWNTWKTQAKYSLLSNSWKKDLSLEFIYFWENLSIFRYRKSCSLKTIVGPSEEYYRSFHNATFGALSYLKILNLSNSFFGERTQHYLNLICSLKNVSHLNLSQTQLTNDDANSLAEICKSLKKLKVFKIADNFLSNAGAVYLFKEIKSETNRITHLDISLNNICDPALLGNLILINRNLISLKFKPKEFPTVLEEKRGISILVESLKKNTSLTTLEICDETNFQPDTFAEIDRILTQNRERWRWTKGISLWWWGEKFKEEVWTFMVVFMRERDDGTSSVGTLTEGLLCNIVGWMSLYNKFVGKYL